MKRSKKLIMLVFTFLMLTFTTQAFAAGEVVTYNDYVGGYGSFTSEFQLNNGVARVDYSVSPVSTPTSNWDFYIGVYKVDNYGNAHYITGDTIAAGKSSAISGTKLFSGLAPGKYKLKFETNNSLLRANVKVYDLGW
ncbi:hypothetical protein CLPU_2c02140 [Gottschalkia purinilytica]|uniref:Uncharacterized protein n=1 Tax=Gottschalkia purinilytica TaxID=1503 RepID=A0A0L0WE54_GOTPU|nr:hypothetical protein [Gottschalkia purinilytica]KNF09762.1 hypothetical protein CLPU_2c02140 [Gottschalkia purinilytica]